MREEGCLGRVWIEEKGSLGKCGYVRGKAPA